MANRKELNKSHKDIEPVHQANKRMFTFGDDSSFFNERLQQKKKKSILKNG